MFVIGETVEFEGKKGVVVDYTTEKALVRFGRSKNPTWIAHNELLMIIKGER